VTILIFLALGDFDDGGRGSEAGEGSRLSKPLDVEEFRKHAHQMVDFVADYHRDIESFPVRSQVKVRNFFLKNIFFILPFPFFLSSFVPFLNFLSKLQ
jgi:hypothetical protein